MLPQQVGKVNTLRNLTEVKIDNHMKRKPEKFYVTKQLDVKLIQDSTWYDEYFKLETEIEKMEEENRKLDAEINKRKERFNKNEMEYRDQIKYLERELRIRYRQEPNAKDAN